ncbi:Ribosomal protein S5 domain 2-type fold [Pseudocohnilembus persalinus]|uniref:Ribosomal protein S5 domain 2-type fold n=1 Tax=Pseudocohnilembus persalinus TaxID=266149 RepID=A0A0V0QSD9_PSEPJ|nr:Ribosomal protein S5 domain 2-type fold [Pseudocohnilembus persalinus]|eukprot:KRX05241.1 Ribosomal protein S5 domain 2-type fold [Pseudocohnilembus persalinus]
MDVRPFKLQQLEKGKSNARAFYESSDNKIICAIYGPSHTRQRANPECEINIELNFISDQKFQENTNKNREQDEKNQKYLNFLKFKINEVLQSVVLLDEYQKSTISIILDILELNSPPLVPILNLLNYSLILSGLKIQEQFSSSLCLYNPQNQQIYLDPTNQEIEQLQKYNESENQKMNDQKSVILNLVIAGKNNKIIYLNMDGIINDKSLYEKLFSAGVSYSNSILKLQQQFIQQAFQ